MPIYPSQNTQLNAVAAPATPFIPLTAYLADCARSPILHKKTFFTPEHVLFGEYMAASSYLYETCAVLGYTYRDKIVPFVGMFSQAGKETVLIEDFTGIVSSQLKKFGKEPENFLELYLMPEALVSCRYYKKQVKYPTRIGLISRKSLTTKFRLRLYGASYKALLPKV